MCTLQKVVRRLLDLHGHLRHQGARWCRQGDAMVHLRYVYVLQPLVLLTSLVVVLLYWALVYEPADGISLIG